MRINLHKPAVIRFYRSTPKEQCTDEKSPDILCQYTCLDRIGRDFTAMEICWHIMLRLVPALKKRIVKYARMGRQEFMKKWHPESAPPGVGNRSVLHKDLSRGEEVRVLAYHDIEPTLNSQYRYKGLSFMKGMRPYCGEPVTVLKEPRLVLDHGGRKIQTCKNLVICDRLYCDGTSIRCDRACLYYWKKDWLKGVPAQNMKALGAER